MIHLIESRYYLQFSFIVKLLMIKIGRWTREIGSLVFSADKLETVDQGFLEMPKTIKEFFG
ncbi:MAG: hypothetical protein HLUCCX10_05405 [Algoriphagus marincola HL-49]|uniref:Uncharacterized protein n=1 Tax=Algoriphagus marincola HL-49 TaxID=1305737 RepID=A0A0P7YIP9_9BACT|nr:MAG: hypothetical protein HLUCCX10_05405 [Algoriphagus marincola HL-49]